MKRWIACLMVIAMILGIIPVNVLTVKAEGKAFTVDDTAYGILDTSVKGKKISLGEGYSLTSHKADYSLVKDNYGAGYVLAKEDSTSRYYLIGTNGIVKEFYSESGKAPTFELIFTCNFDTSYEIYKVKNPETGKYDIYNANTNAYHEYGLDDCYSIVSSGGVEEGEYGSGLIYAVKDGKYGLIDQRGIMIYRTTYKDITPQKNCFIGHVSDASGSFYAILSEDGKTDGEKFYEDIKTYEDHVLAVKSLGKYALLHKDSLKLMTDAKYFDVSFMTYSNQYYMLCEFHEETTDKYDVTDTSAQIDIFKTDGTNWNINAKFGGIKAGYSIRGDVLDIYVSDMHGVSGANGKEAITNRYLVYPDGDIKYICEEDVYDSYHRVQYCRGCYGKLEVTQFTEEDEYRLFDDNYKQLEVITSLERIGKYLFVTKESDAYTYIVYDTTTGKVIYDNLYTTYALKEESKAIPFVNKEPGDKYGIFDVETGEFSGYIFDGNNPQPNIKNITNGAGKIYVVDERSSGVIHYINQDFELISTADMEGNPGSISKSGDKLLLYKEPNENSGYYNMSILNYDNSEVKSFATNVDYTDGSSSEFESYQTFDFDTYDIGLITNDGRIITDNIHEEASDTYNGLTLVKKDEDTIGIIDNNGDALLYGEYDIEDTGKREKSLFRGNFLSFVKDGAVYMYDFSDCYGYYEADEESEMITEDDLYGAYSQFLNNSFYNSMCDNVELQIADTLSNYGHSAKVIAFAKSALDGKTKYVLKKLINMVPGVNIDETKAHRLMALEYIQELDTEAVDNYLKDITDKKDIIDKISETFTTISSLGTSQQKSEFVKIWAGNNAKMQDDIYKMIDKVQDSQEKLADYTEATGNAVTVLDYCVSYLSLYTMEQEMILQLMELIPEESELYNGLRDIYIAQETFGLANMAVEMMESELLDIAAEATEDALIEIFSVKNTSLVGLIIDVSCKIISKTIDSPDLETIDKAVLAFANSITLKEAIAEYQFFIKSNYENEGNYTPSIIKSEYSLLCSTYFCSLFTGLKYAKEIAKEDEIMQIDRYLADYEKKLIYRSYIGTCLINARAEWEYTVEANKAVISKLKTTYPTGIGRIPIEELYGIRFESDEEYIRDTYFSTYTIDVPSQIDGYEVSTLDADAFYGEQNISGVYVPDSVDSIDTKSFQDCNGIVLVVGSSENVEEKYEDVENTTIQVREKEIEKLEIISVPEVTTMGIQDEVDTTGLKIKVTYVDGTTKEVENDFYCDIEERKVGQNEVVVCYGGHEVTYPVEITASECSYTISYVDEKGNLLADKVTGTAMAGTTLNIVSPEIAGFEPVLKEQSVVIGYENDFTVVYTTVSVKLILSDSSVSLYDEDTYQLSVSVEEGTVPAVKWTSSNPEVATVDENGKVTAISKGTAEISVEVVNRSDTKEVCNVTVKNTYYRVSEVEELESTHGYANSTDETWIYESEEAKKLKNPVLKVTFDEQTCFEDGFDFLRVYDKDGNFLYRYTGTQLAGATIEVPGDGMRLKLTSDAGFAMWGFKVTNITVEGEAAETPSEELKFASASLTLHDNIAINFKARTTLFTETGYENAYIVFEHNGEETIVRDSYESGKNTVFDFTNIAPHQMDDTITATLYAEFDGVEYKSEPLEYSVSKYAYNMLGKYNTDDWALLRTLLVDLLNYGSQSQIYTGYNTDALVNGKLTDAQKAWGTSEARAYENKLDTTYATVVNPTAVWKAAGLNLKDRVEIRLKFVADDIDNLVVKARTDSGNEWTIESTEFEPIEGGGYYVYFNKFNAGQMSEIVYFTLYEGDAAVSNTLRYSIESYASSTVGKSEKDESYVPLADLLKKMMMYGDSAKNYINQ